MNCMVLRPPLSKNDVRAGKKRHIQVIAQEGWELPAETTLFVAQGVNIPWRLLDAGFHFLERWEAAAPLWRYGKIAADLGGPKEQKRTLALVKDLRVPVYGHELLFVRDCDGGRQLLEAWRGECDGGDERLAFLRALCRVKPIFLALPRSWLYETGTSQRAERRRHKSALVKVEIAPGRYVRCRPGDEEMMKKRYSHQIKRMTRKRGGGKKGR